MQSITYKSIKWNVVENKKYSSNNATMGLRKYKDIMYNLQCSFTLYIKYRR